MNFSLHIQNKALQLWPPAQSLNFPGFCPVDLLQFIRKMLKQSGPKLNTPVQLLERSRDGVLTIFGHRKSSRCNLKFKSLIDYLLIQIKRIIGNAIKMYCLQNCQLILKGLFGILNSSKKTNEKFNLTAMIPQVL